MLMISDIPFSRGDARCTIHCPQAVGKIPSLQCKVCLCLYHHECAKKPLNDIDGGTSFTCEVKKKFQLKKTRLQYFASSKQV